MTQETPQQPQQTPPPMPAPQAKWYMDRGIQASIIGGIFTVIAGGLGIATYYIRSAPSPAQGSQTVVGEEITTNTNGVIEGSSTETRTITSSNGVVGVACPKRGDEFVYKSSQISARSTGLLFSTSGDIISSADFLTDASSLHEQGCFILIPTSENQAAVLVAKVVKQKKSTGATLSILHIEGPADGQGDVDLKITNLLTACSEVEKGDKVNLLTASGGALVSKENSVSKVERDKITLGARVDDELLGAIVQKGNCYAGLLAEDKEPFVLLAKNVDKFIEEYK